MSLTPTTSGQYGFNGQLNVLGTVSTPAITLNGTDLQTTLNTISSGGSELENGLLDGTIVPLRSTNADHTKITVAGTDNRFSLSRRNRRNLHRYPMGHHLFGLER